MGCGFAWLGAACQLGGESESVCWSWSVPVPVHDSVKLPFASTTGLNRGADGATGASHLMALSNRRPPLLFTSAAVLSAKKKNTRRAGAVTLAYNAAPVSKA